MSENPSEPTVIKLKDGEIREIKVQCGARHAWVKFFDAGADEPGGEGLAVFAGGPWVATVKWYPDPVAAAVRKERERCKQKFTTALAALCESAGIWSAWRETLLSAVDAINAEPEPEAVSDYWRGYKHGQIDMKSRCLTSGILPEACSVIDALQIGAEAALEPPQ